MLKQFSLYNMFLQKQMVFKSNKIKNCFVCSKGVWLLHSKVISVPKSVVTCSILKHRLCFIGQEKGVKGGGDDQKIVHGQLQDLGLMIHSQLLNH